jgi:DNA-binding Lrp family transcriptional regulator
MLNMARSVSDYVVDEVNLRLIASLQCDGRATAEHVGEVLGVSPRIVARRWSALIGDGTIRVLATAPRPAVNGVMLLRIRVLRGKIEAVARALAARDDIPMIDISAGGDQLTAVLLAGPDHHNNLVFRQLPATTAVTSVEAETIVHVYADTGDWRLDVLSPDERRRLTPVRPAVGENPDLSAERHDASGPQETDEIDQEIGKALAADARMPAAAVARATGYPPSTVRRRLSALFDQGKLRTHTLVVPRRLGLGVDADIRMRVAPAHLDEVGQQLAAHPAVHGAVATTGTGNLFIALWLRDLDDLHRFITKDLAALEVDNIDTILVGREFKRSGLGW